MMVEWKTGQGGWNRGGRDEGDPADNAHSVTGCHYRQRPLVLEAKVQRLKRSETRSAALARGYRIETWARAERIVGRGPDWGPDVDDHGTLESMEAVGDRGSAPYTGVSGRE